MFGVSHGGGGGGESHFQGAKFSISSRLVGDLIHSITCLMPSIHTSPRESMSCRNFFKAENKQNLELNKRLITFRLHGRQGCLHNLATKLLC